MSLSSSLTTIRYYTAADPYFYGVDNRPLSDIEQSTITIANYIDTGIFTSPLTSSSSTAGIGYAVGAGGSQTQLTSKATGVTLSKVTGQITMNNAALNAATSVSFTLTNTTIAATDILECKHVSAGTAGAYTVTAFPGASSATITVRNVSAGSLSEAIVLAFAVIKAVIT